VKTFGLILVLILHPYLAPSSFAGSAKVLLYHHVSAETPASTSVTPEVFASHLELLEQGGYQVVALERIVNTLIAGDELDSKWVAITFDDAYRSVLTEAFPLLKRRGWPFTVFVSTDFIDQSYGLYLNWDELRSLEAQGGLMANHTLNHEHLVRLRPEESTEMWLNRVSAQVTESQARLDAELDHPAKLFAYPYGEFSEPLTHLLASLDFIAFGQQSGPVGTTSNPQALPRFPLASGFDSVQSLAEKLRTEHLPLSDPEVPATLLRAESPAPVLTLQIDAPGIQEGALNCFVGGQPAPAIRWTDPQTVEIEAERALGAGRRKYTCTAPFPGIRGAFYWHTHLWIQPRKDGSWYQG
jgi:biofilm PGA synthesis lipoprotein PgaB